MRPLYRGACPTAWNPIEAYDPLSRLSTLSPEDTFRCLFRRMSCKIFHLGECSYAVPLFEAAVHRCMPCGLEPDRGIRPYIAALPQCLPKTLYFQQGAMHWAEIVVGRLSKVGPPYFVHNLTIHAPIKIPLPPNDVGVKVLKNFV